MRLVSISLDDLEIRISQLREHANALLKEADEVEAFLKKAAELGTESSANFPIATTRKTRKQELSGFLRARGPHTRKDICEATGIPDGTVAYEMRDREVFTQNRDGTWDLVESLRPPSRARLAAAIEEDDVPF